MTETFTLVHLTDLHLGPIVGFGPRHWNVKRGLGLVNWHRGRVRLHRQDVADVLVADALAQQPDHIAVTGDLANLGLPGEIDAALGWLSQLGPPDRVSVVPGNHDIYSGRHATSVCLTAWAPYMRGGESSVVDGPATFPYVRTFGAVALIGVNSAVPTAPFVAAGRVGASQIADLEACLARLGAEGFIRVVLIHHPPLPGQAPPRRALADAKSLAEMIDRAGADLVLHGHNHRDTLAWATHAGRPVVPVLGGASASASHAHKDEPLARYNIIRIRRDASGLSITAEARGLTEPGGPVVRVGLRDLTPPAN